MQHITMRFKITHTRFPFVERYLSQLVCEVTSLAPHGTQLSSIQHVCVLPKIIFTIRHFHHTICIIGMHLSGSREDMGLLPLMQAEEVPHSRRKPITYTRNICPLLIKVFVTDIYTVGILCMQHAWRFPCVPRRILGCS